MHWGQFLLTAQNCVFRRCWCGLCVCVCVYACVCGVHVHTSRASQQSTPTDHSRIDSAVQGTCIYTCTTLWLYNEVSSAYPRCMPIVVCAVEWDCYVVSTSWCLQPLWYGATLRQQCTVYYMYIHAVDPSRPVCAYSTTPLYLGSVDWIHGADICCYCFSE